MLTDPKRGPFKIETWETKAKDPPWDNTFWSWRLIDAEGICLESGTGYTSQGEAHAQARAVRDNEAA